MAKQETRHGASNARRLTKREVERRREKRRKVLVPALAVAIVVAGLAGVIILAPMLSPPAPVEPPHLNRPVEQRPMHIHVELALYQGTQKATLPEDIGRNPARWVDHTLDRYLAVEEGAVGSLSPLHTHDNSGTIHVESSVTTAFTLGEFFAVWGQPFGPDRVVNLVRNETHTLTMTVNGVPDEQWGNLVLVDQQHIEVHYDPL